MHCITSQFTSRYFYSRLSSKNSDDVFVELMKEEKRKDEEMSQ